MPTYGDLNLKKYKLIFNESSLACENHPKKIIIHHTGNPIDDDLSARQIHSSHLNVGLAGIGYHFVVRKSGQLEKGRNLECKGAHCYGGGMNNNSIGIHLSGNFELAKPTDEQIEKVAILMADLCIKYDLNPYQDIKGHQDYDNTVCPGKKLYEIMDIICGKVQFYIENGW